MNERYQPDRARQAILGISMGAKQALTLVLDDAANAGFSVLGLLRGRFQDKHIDEVHGGPASWPPNRGRTFQLYFHYCGQGADIPGAEEPAWGQRRRVILPE